MLLRHRFRKPLFSIVSLSVTWGGKIFLSVPPSPRSPSLLPPVFAVYVSPQLELSTLERVFGNLHPFGVFPVVQVFVTCGRGAKPYRKATLQIKTYTCEPGIKCRFRLSLNKCDSS